MPTGIKDERRRAAAETSANGTGALPFTCARLLAPMEGVTDPLFRELVLARNPPEVLGGTFTEFARVVREPLSARALAEHLGERSFPQPVGLQLMGSDRAAVAATAARAFELGVALVDLNFGCPSKGALRGCAGSALLEDPSALERMVAAVCAVAEGRPVSAKLRAGGEDDRRLEELVRAVEDGGASLVTVHCRTRAEGYRDCADWDRLRRAVAATGLPVCGNGGIESHADLGRMLGETGCAFAMVGRAALGDPWIFSGRAATRAEAASFLLEYASRQVQAGRSPAAAAGRVKQLLHHWRAGGLLGSEQGGVEERRRAWLREADPARLLEQIARRCGATPLDPAPAVGKLTPSRETKEAPPFPLQIGGACG